MATYHSDSGLNISNVFSDLSEDININCDPMWGVWSDGTTIWTSCLQSKGIRAFKLSDGSRDSDRDIPYVSEHNRPRGLWSDGETMWALQDESSGTDKVFSYKYRNNAEGLRIQGSPVTGHTLSADTSSITDPNGLPDSPDFSYQWQYADGTDIAGATDKIYQIRTSDVGKKVRVRVRFTDNARYEEEIIQ